MPVHQEKKGKKYVVVDNAGKQYGSHTKKADAVKQVQAINISAGHTPLTPKKKKKSS